MTDITDDAKIYRPTSVNCVRREKDHFNDLQPMNRVSIRWAIIQRRRHFPVLFGNLPITFDHPFGKQVTGHTGVLAGAIRGK